MALSATCNNAVWFPLALILTKSLYVPTCFFLSGSHWWFLASNNNFASLSTNIWEFPSKPIKLSCSQLPIRWPSEFAMNLEFSATSNVLSVPIFTILPLPFWSTLTVDPIPVFNVPPLPKSKIFWPFTSVLELSPNWTLELLPNLNAVLPFETFQGSDGETSILIVAFFPLVIAPSLNTWSALPKPLRVKSTVDPLSILMFLAPIVALSFELSLLSELTLPLRLTVRLLLSLLSTIFEPLWFTSFKVKVFSPEVLGSKLIKPLLLFVFKSAFFNVISQLPLFAGALT